MKDPLTILYQRSHALFAKIAGLKVNDPDNPAIADLQKELDQVEAETKAYLDKGDYLLLSRRDKK